MLRYILVGSVGGGQRICETKKTELEGWLDGGDVNDDGDDVDVDIPRSKIPGIVVDYG